MKVFRIALCAALLAAATVATAQTSPGDVVVNVPFSFAVSGQMMPAGRYIVAAVGDSHVRIFNQSTPGLFVGTHSAARAASDGSKLVFHRYGESYFLSAVWVTGNTTGRELAVSRAERELAGRNSEMELAVVRPQKLHSRR
jgi:hypothetical protein